jgi:hypothetical protein
MIIFQMLQLYYIRLLEFQINTEIMQVCSVIFNSRKNNFHRKLNVNFNICESEGAL